MSDPTLTTGHKYTNHLENETSPYLLQHVHNPVEWYPWGDEALARAKAEDKPIFLSIGYSACHWCHVMERESFENEEIAKIMNEHFINIKVDREERPDLDEIYMAAVQAMTGSGGWPMSVFLTPELKPFYGGTYYPPRDMYGRPGFANVLLSLAKAYEEQREDLEQAAEKLTVYIDQIIGAPPAGDAIRDDLISSAVENISRRFDPRHGGFGQEPKFPHSMDLSLILREYNRSRDEEQLRMIDLTLKKMANGGLYDQIGGGFHRYSVDAQWLTPHFEKMLYDNALLVRTYTEAWQITRDEFYRKVVRETLGFVQREMTSPEGGFYSTQDADSEGEEGKFYVWTPEEIIEVLGEEKGKIVNRYYGVIPGGNFEHGKSILHVESDLDTVGKLFGKTDDEMRAIILEANCKLYAKRDQRIKPGRDEKILTDWNGLMISAFAFAGNVFNESKYVEAAEKACDFLLDKLSLHDRLLHTYKDGRAHTDAFLSDYANVVQGLLDTYEASQNPRWLREALRLNILMIEDFWDEVNGAFFNTRQGQKHTILRSKNSMDNAVPSGNSVAILNLLRLAEMTGDASLREKAERSLVVFQRGLDEAPMAYGQMLQAVDFMLARPREIVLAGESRESLQEMKNALFSHFLPEKVVLYNYKDAQNELESLAPVAQGKHAQNGTATAYVCQDFTCKQPVISVEELLAEVEK